MANPRLQTRVNESTKERVELFQKRKGEPTESDAVRRLVVQGLETEEGGDSAAEPRIAVAAGFWFVLVGSVLAALSIVAVVAWALTPLPVTPSFVLALAVATIVVNAAAIIRAKHPATDGGDG